MEVDPRVIRAIRANDGLMILYGISVVMIGTTLPEIISTFGLSLAQAGLIVAMQNAGGIAVLLAGTFLADRVSKPIAVAVSFLAVGALLITIGVAPTYTWLLLLFFISGIAIRALDTMLNAFTGALAGESRSRIINLLHMFFGVGALGGPLLAQLAMSGGLSWRYVYVVIGGSHALFLGGLLLYVPHYMRTPDDPAHSDGTADSDRSSVADPRTTTARLISSGPILLGVLLMVYAVHQTGATTWIPHYLRSTRGVSPIVASAALSLYWVGIIAGRFAASRLADRFGAIRLLVAGSALGGVLLVPALMFGNGAVATAGFLTAGILTGATIPLTLTIAYAVFPGGEGSVTALLSMFMLVGRIAGPWAIGKVGDLIGLDASIVMAGAALFVVAVVAAVAARVSALRP